MADTSALTLKEDPSIFKIIYGNKGLMTGLVILAVNLDRIIWANIYRKSYLNKPYDKN
jgi:hypothetical protein